VPAVAWTGALVAVAWPLPMSARTDVVARVTLTDVPTDAGRQALVSLAVDPPSAVRDPEWFTVTAWQGAAEGDGGLVIAPLRDQGGGRWATDRPVPLHDQWKALVRWQSGDSIQVVPLYLPEDPAIPAAGVDAPAQFERSFVPDKDVLQREAIGGTPGLQRLAYALLALIGITWLASIGLGLRRVGRRQPGKPLVAAQG
jgi:hypothetical protein